MSITLLRIILPLLVPMAMVTYAKSQQMPERYSDTKKKEEKTGPLKLTSSPAMPPQVDPIMPERTEITNGRSSRPNEWTSIEIVLSIALLVYGVFSNCLLGWLVMKSGSTWSPRAITNIFSINLIVTGSLLLVIAGYSEKQVTPIINLLVSISSYLLGAATSQMPSGQIQEKK